MDASDLRFFESVARLGGMNRAARELNTVQSNVTARIRALEDELGVKLFRRGSAGVTLTPAGERLMPYAHEVARVLADAARAAGDDGTPSGRLVIGTLETTAALRLTPLLSSFVRAYPQVDLALKTGTSRELAALVIERGADGAFVCGPVEHPALEQHLAYEEDLAILTAPGVTSVDAYLRSGDVRIVVLRAGCSYRLVLEAWLARRGIVGTRILEFGTLEAIIGCVGAGLGITAMPRALFQSVWRDDRVALHRMGNDGGRVETVFIQRRDAFRSSALEAFLAMARPAVAALQAAE